MFLDIRTLIFMLLVFGGTFAVGMYFVQRGQPAMRELRWWAGAYASGALGFLLLSLRGLIPDFLSVVIANDLLLVGQIYFRRGATLFCQKPEPPKWIDPALLVILTLFLIQYTHVTPNMAIRTIAVTLITTIPSTVSAWLLMNEVSPRLRPSYWFTGIAFLQSSLVSVARAAYTFLYPPTDLMGAGPWHTLSFLSIILLFVAAAFGCVWMISIRQTISLEQQARTDPLTGTMNRLALDESAARELARATRSRQPLALIIFDMDFFKQLNDQHGHQAGDDALRKVTLASRQQLRASDLLARYGGEEFLVLMPETDKTSAIDTAGRLRQRIESLGLSCGKGRTLTASFGVAAYPADGDSFECLVTSADAALYAAKQAGRNCVMS